MKRNMKNKILKWSFGLGLMLAIGFALSSVPALAVGLEPGREQLRIAALVGISLSLVWNLVLTVLGILANRNNRDTQQKLKRSQSELAHASSQQIRELSQLKSVTIPGLQQQIRDLQTNMKGVATYVEGGISVPPNQYSYPQQSSPVQTNNISSQHYQGSPVVDQSHNSLPSNPWDHIVEYYNSNPSSLESYAVGVSETENSILRRRQNSSAQEVTLSQTANNSYWVIAGQDAQSYWIVPKTDLKFRPGVFETFQSLFKSPEYQPGFKLHLVKPARVEQSSAGEWELADKGEVQFIR
jgi:hypothetical protein